MKSFRRRRYGQAEALIDARNKAFNIVMAVLLVFTMLPVTAFTLKVKLPPNHSITSRLIPIQMTVLHLIKMAITVHLAVHLLVATMLLVEIMAPRAVLLPNLVKVLVALLIMDRTAVLMTVRVPIRVLAQMETTFLLETVARATKMVPRMEMALPIKATTLIPRRLTTEIQTILEPPTKKTIPPRLKMTIPIMILKTPLNLKMPKISAIHLLGSPSWMLAI